MTKEQAYINESRNLDELLDRPLEIQLFEDLSLRIFGRVDDRVSLNSLPAFGGDPVTFIVDGSRTTRVLSYDQTRLLVPGLISQSGEVDFQIQPRKTHFPPKVYADGEWRPMSETFEESETIVIFSKNGSLNTWTGEERKKYREHIYGDCSIAWMPAPACLLVVPEWFNESGE